MEKDRAASRRELLQVPAQGNRRPIQSQRQTASRKTLRQSTALRFRARQRHRLHRLCHDQSSRLLRFFVAAALGCIVRSVKSPCTQIITNELESLKRSIESVEAQETQGSRSSGTNSFAHHALLLCQRAEQRRTRILIIALDRYVVALEQWREHKFKLWCSSNRSTEGPQWFQPSHLLRRTTVAGKRWRASCSPVRSRRC